MRQDATYSINCGSNPYLVQLKSQALKPEELYTSIYHHILLKAYMAVGEFSSAGESAVRSM